MMTLTTPETQTAAAATTWTNAVDPSAKRNVWTAMKRGFACRCPNCGEGKLFRAFLKVDDHCSECGQDFSAHRADDLPAYLVIVIVGHLLVPMILWIETDYSPPVWLQLSIYLPVTLIASLALLQPVKGAVVGLQWAFRMHGFGGGPALIGSPSVYSPLPSSEALLRAGGEVDAQRRVRVLLSADSP